MARINLKDIAHSYMDAPQAEADWALKPLNHVWEDGGAYALLGPSGCGKTTTLRCVAGLERPDSGEIVVDGDIVFSSEKNIWVPPHERNIGMVFQSYAIWPHMSVFENVAFPLSYKKPRPSRAEAKERVMTALSLVQLDGLEDRPAPFLSGGQQQRLALARALVAEPRMLLLDEPLSNLDAKLREEMRFELAELVKRLNITTLFVTHEQIEALTMSDRMAVMNQGAIAQEGSPTEIYAAPQGAFVADFIGKTNFLEGNVLEIAQDSDIRSAQVQTAIGTFACRMTGAASVGDPVTIAVRPENVMLATPQATGNGNIVEGQVEVVVFLGNMLDCAVNVDGHKFHMQLHPTAAPAVGHQIQLHFPAEHILAMRS